MIGLNAFLGRSVKGFLEFSDLRRARQRVPLLVLVRCLKFGVPLITILGNTGAISGIKQGVSIGTSLIAKREQLKLTIGVGPDSVVTSIPVFARVHHVKLTVK